MIYYGYCIILLLYTIVPLWWGIYFCQRFYYMIYLFNILYCIVNIFNINSYSFLLFLCNIVIIYQSFNNLRATLIEWLKFHKRYRIYWINSKLLWTFSKYVAYLLKSNQKLYHKYKINKKSWKQIHIQLSIIQLWIQR